MQSGLSKRLGRILSIKKSQQGIDATTSHGFLRIRFFSTAVAQISITSTDVIESYPYSVIGIPESVPLQIEDQPDHLILRTSEIDLQVIKDPVSLIFRNAEGQVLSEDDPGLGTSWIGEQVTTYKKLQEGERFIGLGEKTGPLDRRGAGYQNWNTDAFSYHKTEDPLYCSTPFYIGVHHGLQYGIYLDNTHKSFFNFGASTNRFSSFSADRGDMNYYFIQGQSVADIIQHYTQLTGRMPLPPRWSIGYQQCRYSYYPDAEVRSVAQTFREKNIPADAIVLDIHYMDQYKIFTWDSKNFPDAAGLINYLKSLNFEVILMCDPGIKVEAGYEPYEDGLKQDVFLKYPDGEYYSGQVWPGWCHFPDYTNPKTRAWWKEKLRAYSELGVEGYWNDMNEIATWGHMLPENVEFDHEGEKVTSRKARNIYGFQMARSTYEGTKQLLGGKRPFNLTRAGFSGIQRFAAVWTGDNVSYDEHMMLGIRMVNSMGLAGISFAGYDVGGFVGESSTYLFARWISIGAFSPFFRGHTMVNTRNAEPWAFGEEVENISRNYIRFRYQLMPYIYSAFYESTKTGMPVQRSLAIMHTHDPRVYNTQFQQQYMFGKFVMIAPVESTKELTKVFFPEGQWYYLFDGKKIEGNQEALVESPIHKLPVYIKAGAILPMQAPIMHAREKVTELILHIYAGTEDTSFEYYEDDGATFAFEQGDFSLRVIQYNGTSSSITIEEQAGAFRSTNKTIKLVLHGTSPIQQVKVNSKSVACHHTKNIFFLPLEKYDPITDPDTMGNEEVQEATFPYTSETIEISW